MQERCGRVEGYGVDELGPAVRFFEIHALPGGDRHAGRGSDSDRRRSTNHHRLDRPGDVFHRTKFDVHRLPPFVKQTIERLIACGDPERGSIRLRCRFTLPYQIPVPSNLPTVLAERTYPMSTTARAIRSVTA